MLWHPLHTLRILALLMFSALGVPITEERAELADAIATTVHEHAPLFRDDETKVRTLGLEVAVAFREGSLRTSVIGDGGDSFCSFQIHKSIGGTIELTRDAYACAEKAHELLRQSIRVCREHPIAWYAEGPHGCESARAQRISADRVALGRWLAGR